MKVWSLLNLGLGWQFLNSIPQEGSPRIDSKYLSMHFILPLTLTDESLSLQKRVGSLALGRVGFWQ